MKGAYSVTKEQTRKVIGENIRRERLQRGISAIEFAEMLELSPGFVGLIERGERGTTSANLYKIASVFNLSTDELFESNSEESVELEQQEAKRNRIMSLMFDFSDGELDYIANTVLGLRTLRNLPSIAKQTGE